MDKLKLYNFCKTMREEGSDWLSVWRACVKVDLITKEVGLQELKAVYRDVAGQIAAGETVTAPGGYNDSVQAFFDFIGKTNDAIAGNVKVKQDDNVITIVITDVHVPYHDMEKIEKVVKRWSGVAHRLVIGGDFLNGTQLSSHPKTIVEDFKKECTEGRVLLEYLASKFPEVVLLDDNHVHSRWGRYISKVLTPDLHFLTIHPYDFLTAGIPNVVRAKATHSFEHRDEIGWFYVFGDAVIAHAEVSSAVDMKPARKVEEFVRKWRPVLELPEIRFVMQAHCHRLGIVHETDSAVAMTGCMVTLEGLTYSMSAELKGHPPTHGYVVVVQDKNGKTILEECQVVKLPLKN